MSGELKSEAKARFRSLRGKRYESAFESLVYDPKLGDLTLSKVKRGSSLVEACRGSRCNCSSNLGLGVKSPSSLGIAGSYRNWP